MADVIATEVGKKRVSLAVVNGRYVITNPGTYRLHLNAPVDPFPPTPASFTITDAQPTPVASTADPAFTITGTGFLSGPFDLYAFGASSFGSYLIPPIAYNILDDTTIQVFSGLLPTLMGLPYANPPLSFVFVIAQGVTPLAQSPAVNVTTAPVGDPMADAVFNPFTGDPWMEEVNVATGPGYGLRAMIPPAAYQDSMAIGFAPTTDWTFAVWFRRADFPGDGLATFADYPLNTGIIFSLYNGSMENIQVTIGPMANLQSPPLSYPATDMGWHLLVVTRKSVTAELILYIDGAQIDAFLPAPPNTVMQHNANLTYGKDQLMTASTQAAAAAWNRALTPSEVTDLWTNTVFPP